MPSQTQGRSRDRSVRGQPGHEGRVRLIVGLLTVLAGVGLLGSFHWTVRSGRPQPAPSRGAAPHLESFGLSRRPEVPLSFLSDRPPNVLKAPASHPWDMGPFSSLRARALGATGDLLGTRAPVAITVTPSVVTAALGQNAVELAVTMAGAEAFSSGTVMLAYDPAILEVMSVHAVKGPAPFAVNPRVEQLQGKVTVALTSMGREERHETGGGLFAVQFLPLDLGRSEVVLMEATFTDGAGSSVPVLLTNGAVEVAAD